MPGTSTSTNASPLLPRLSARPVPTKVGATDKVKRFKVVVCAQFAEGGGAGELNVAADASGLRFCVNGLTLAGS